MPFKDIEKKKLYQKEYFAKYRKENREKVNKLKREWRLKNLEHSKKQAAKYARKYRTLYPERFKVYDKKNGKNQRIKFARNLRALRIDMGGSCSQCGYSEEIDILHFHHTGQYKKEKEVTRYSSIEKAREEAKKCILLCPNCHALHHLYETND